MLKKVQVVAISLALLVSGFIATAKADQPEAVGNMLQLQPGMRPVIITPSRSSDLVPSVSGKSTLYTGRANTSAISYTYNNPVMNTPEVVLVWYGSWAKTPSAPANAPAVNDYYNFINQFINDLSGSARWRLNNNYYSVLSGKINKISGLLNTANNVFVDRNTSLYPEPMQQSTILNIAKEARKTVADNNSKIYLVLTSSNVAVTGFNAGTVQFCGWHSAESTAPSMKYGFVGDSYYATSCQGQKGGSPNNNIGADSMLSVIAHEIEEAATDPYVYGTVWRDTKGYENSDKCAWTWGTTLTDTNTNSFYNLNLNGHKYLIQQGFKLGTNKSTLNKDTWSGTCANG